MKAKHPGDYFIGKYKNDKFVRCLLEDEKIQGNGFILFNKRHKNFYDENGILLPIFWSLPRTKIAEEIS